MTAESTVLDVASARTATTITSKMIEQLPRGRTFNTLLQMAPGVRAEGKSGTAGVGGYQFDGTSGSENVFVIDGVDVSNIRRASLEVQDAIPFEFVQEVQIKSGGFEAEFGGALGGVVNVISKSGSDTFHGEGMYQFSGSSLNEARRNLADVPGQSTLPVAGGGSATAGKSFRRNPFDVTQAELFTPPEDDYRPELRWVYARRSYRQGQAALLRRLRARTPQDGAVDRLLDRHRGVRRREGLVDHRAPPPRNRTPRLRAVPEAAGECVLLLESTEDDGAADLQRRQGRSSDYGSRASRAAMSCRMPRRSA